MRFGVIADPQYGDKDKNIWHPERGFREALPKLNEAIGALNQENLDFVIYLGDMVDDNIADYPPVIDALGRSKHQNLIVLGNHDYIAAKHDAKKLCDIFNLEHEYYSLTKNGYRLIILDTNEGPNKDVNITDEELLEAELNRNKAADELDLRLTNDHFWNGLILDEQREWLIRELEAARSSGEKVLIFGHDPIYPIISDSLQNSKEILGIITPYMDIIEGYFAGHHHYGAYAEFINTPFITFKGMILEPGTSYSIVEIDDTGLRVIGFGSAASYNRLKQY